jgi:hypothetical protein
MSDAAMTDGPVFHIEPKAELANRMTQYMVALKFQSLVPGCRIANVRLPEWGIEHPPIESPDPVEKIARVEDIDMAGLTEHARSRQIRCVVYSGFGQKMANFLGVDAYRNVFRAPLAAPIEFGEQYLVCPIGASAEPEARSVFHPLMPVEFYADVAAETGLTPVFVGQGAPGLYTDHLRAQFPQATFVGTGSAMQDFEVIRQAKNIVVGASIYGWLAAWLSHAERIIMAVNGLFNPMQYGSIDLLPFGDSRYRFSLFPINFHVPPEFHAAAHRRMAPFWRPISHEALLRRLQEAGRFDPSNEEILENFDPEFYLATYTDVARLVGAGNVEGARAHYMLLGIREQRLPFRLAPAWYAARYPMAALEVSQGDYRNFAHHYIAVGRGRGYRPLPREGEPWWD